MRRMLHLHPGEGRERRALLQRKREWLSDQRIELVLADDWIAAEDRALYADAVLLPPAEEVGAALAALRRAPALERCDGVLLHSEAALPVGSLFAAERGLPAPRPEAVRRCFDKSATRAALAAAGVAQPDFALARDAADVQRFRADHGGAVMLKALASTMARLVTRIEPDAPAAAIEAAVARLRTGLGRSRDVRRLAGFAAAGDLPLPHPPHATFLVETFAPGDPVECDGLVVGGRAATFGALEQVLTPAPLLYLDGYLLPADRPVEERIAIETTATRAAEATLLDAAGFSVELRSDGTTARVIEVNGRLGEDVGLWELFERVAGRDPFELAVAVALGEAPTFASAPSAADRAAERHALAFACRFEECVVAEAPSAMSLAATLARAPAAARARAGCCVQPGDELHAPPHPDTFPHVAWALASARGSSRAAYATARSLAHALPFRFAPAPPLPSAP